MDGMRRCGGWFSVRRSTKYNRRGMRSSQLIFWLVVAATGLAAFARLFALDSLPPQAWVDEIWFALRARDLLLTGQVPIFYKTFWGGVNPMLVYLTAAAQWLALREVIVASRAVSAAFGVLSVPLAFACFREFWQPSYIEPTPRDAAGNGRWLAALTAIILSNFYFTVNLSRIGTEPAVALAAGLFCVWQMRRAERTGAWPSFLLAGLGAGWAQYVSPHARFIPVIMALFGLHRLWLTPSAHRARLLKGYGLLTGAAILIALPLIVFFVREPEWFFGRARTVTAGLAQRGAAPALVDNARAIALSFSVVGDANPRDNLAYRPLLDVIQSLGFYFGVGWALLHLRRSPQARDLLLWLVVMVAPSLVTDDAPSFSRMINVAPPVAALIALGWSLIYSWACVRWTPRLGQTILGLMVVASLLLNGVDYFVRYARHPQVPAAFTTTAVDLARRLIERAQTESVFVERVSEAEEDIYAFDFLFPGTPVQRLDFRQCLPLVDGRTTRTTYVVWSERDALTAPELRRRYPSAQVTRLVPEAEALFRELTLVEIGPGTPARAASHLASARFAPGLALLGYEQSTLEVRPGESVLFTFYWRAEGVLTNDATPFLHVGSGLADSRNIAQHDGQPCQGFYPTSRWKVGDVVPDRFAVIIPTDAPPGEYPLVVGWYQLPSLQRLALESAATPLPDHRAVIGTLRVVGP